ncbi:TRAP transporter substrate-binding protein DctP [Alkalihalobacterium alkalinitrilicum]|uniref:TRAP transporter substrate-binding protein DctP n=1 Tax=Alkalihalobacterium alkalinitrilicum TaxID=427920 RepID=UPI00099540EE|nr:TRAP transporter substrate-binding protein DctP [Alkalihalobacterium alkalinitrilicum]
MKKNLIILMFVSLFVLMVAACSGGGSEPSNSEGASNEGNDSGEAANTGETIKLRVATGLSEQHGWWQGFMVPWMDRVEELTDGQVQFEGFAGGELVEVVQEPDALKNGTADVAILIPFYHENLFPASSITFLPVSFTDEFISGDALNKLMESDVALGDTGKTYYESHYGDNGFKTWALNAGAVYSISTTGHEFNSVDDVKGISMRTPNLLFELMAKNMGVNSVSMNIVEAFDALNRGAFEGIFHTVADWTGAGFQDLLTYTIDDLFLGSSNGVFAMTQETWDSLPSNVQDAMNQAQQEMYENGIQEWVTRAEETRAYNVEEAGGQFISFLDLPEDVQQHITEANVKTWYDYIDFLESNGNPGKEIAILWRDLLIEAGGDVPDELMNLEDY